jgi:hypothetical protein
MIAEALWFVKPSSDQAPISDSDLGKTRHDVPEPLRSLHAPPLNEKSIPPGARNYFRMCARAKLLEPATKAPRTGGKQGDEKEEHRFSSVRAAAPQI